ncbi:beta-microseminoprotein-like [Lingula anatina]|uniref:Beta-microseminoprotein-like n=1 Tax=Lingula anatina TaxID=7574 RepID=A0A1S3HAF8_LINAN|nr:beta-microseminoprotein-like [Lingula anatina]|eukprot:XP_013382441.1 beta-microseminoprotein-like [Lingula anatina]
MGLLFQLVAVLLVARGISGYCFAKSETHRENAFVEPDGSVKVTNYCEYKAKILFPGDTARFPDECISCTCEDWGLSCCGYGSSAGVISVQGCKQIKGPNCSYLLVKESDPTKDCFTGQSIVG